MDDVSKVQQINNLARELMKHGQASSMEEAIHKATAQVEGSAVAPAPELPQMPEAPAPEGAPEAPVEDVEVKPAETVEAPVEEMPKSDISAEDLLRKFEGIVGNQQTHMGKVTDIINTHTKQMEEVNSKINGLIAEMTEMKANFEKMQNSPVAPALKPKAANAGQTQFKSDAPAPAAAEVKPKQDGSGHVRSGNYNPEDVSVEKFFYYGGK